MSVRRRWLSVGLLSVVVATVAGCKEVPAPEPLFSIEHRSVQGSAPPSPRLTPTGTPKEPLTLPDDPIWVGSGTPHVLGDLVVGFISVGDRLHNRLQAVEGTTGRTLWSASVSTVGDGPPVAVDGDEAMLYTITSARTHSYTRYTTYLTAVDVARGEIRWMEPVGDNVSRPGGLEVIVADSGVAVVSGGWDRGTTYAFDTRDGAELWHHKNDNIVDVGERVVLERDGRFGEPEYQIAAIDARNGEELWAQPVHENATAAINGDTVLMSDPPRYGEPGSTTLRDTSSGTLITKVSRDLGEECFTGPGTYVCRADYDEVVAVDAETGMVRWEVTAEQVDLEELFVTTVGESRVYLSSGHDKPGAVVDLRSGEVLRTAVGRLPLQFGNGFVIGESGVPDPRDFAVYANPPTE